MPFLSGGQNQLPDYEGVPGDGPKNARIVLLGEAPARQELRAQPGYPRGRPFVGQAGSVLTECMHNAGMIRKECYVTNVFKKQVQKKGADFYIDGNCVYKAKQGYTEYAIPWIKILKEELEGLDGPNVIVAMGEAAAFTMAALTGITRVRGSVYPCPWEGKLSGTKIIPCIHPAAALRQYLWRYYIIFDLRKAKAESEFHEIKMKERSYIHRPSVEVVESYIRELIHERKDCAIDVECYNQEISVFGIGRDTEGMVIPFMMGNEHYYSIGDEIRIWKALAEYLEHPEIGVTGQNLTFDLGEMLAKKMNIFARGPIFDTMVAMKQLYPDFDKGLHVIASLFSDLPYYKDELKLWNTNMLAKLGGSVEQRMTQLWDYNEKDVEATWDGRVGLEKELRSRGMWDTFSETMRTFPAMLYLETRGITVNVKELSKVKFDIETKLIELQTELDELAGMSLNVNSPKQLKYYFYELHGVKPYKDRKTGNTTCNDDALKRLSRATTVRKGFREAAIIREMRGLKKLHGTYLAIDLEEDQRLRCAINPSGTKNGRWSTSKTLYGKGTNMQNLPSQFKRFLEADPGCLFWEIDKAQGEWVICAYVAGDENMIQVVESGEDAHTGTAHRAFGVPKGLIIKEAKAAGHETNPTELRRIREELVPEILAYNIPGSMTCRQAGKKGNHGLNYDLSYKGFAFHNEIPEAEAKVICEGYHAGYPMVRGGLHSGVRNQLRKDRTLTNVFGRKRTFYDRWGDTLFKDGYAFPAQSGLVDLVNRGLASTMEDQDRWWMHRVDLLAQVHDSIAGQWWVGDYAYRGMSLAMIQIGDYLDPELSWQGRTFRIRNDIKVGLNWGEWHPEHNPVGMLELNWTNDPADLSEQLWEAHTKLIENTRNL